MLQELLDAIFQTLAFALIPFIVYLIQNKESLRFFSVLRSLSIQYQGQHVRCTAEPPCFLFLP